MATMTEYDFTQQVDYPSILVASIQASSISIPLVNMETSGSGPTMEVSLFFQDVLSSIDQTTLSSIMAAYVNSLPTSQIVANSISNAIKFGQQLTVSFAAQNVLSGITQAGQTIPVATYMQSIAYYLNSGSLYAAITEINTLIADTSSTKTALSPFITNNILYSYLNQIQAYLGITQTPNPGA